MSAVQQKSRGAVKPTSGSSRTIGRCAKAAVSSAPGAVDPANSSIPGMVMDPLHPLDRGGCYICKDNKKQELILLCDGCEGEFHTFCVDPPLSKVPQGSWFCPSCKAAGKGVPKSRYTGVAWAGKDKFGKNMWQAKIRKRARGEAIIGIFGSPKEAARAYDEAARETLGDSAELNFPDGNCENAESDGGQDEVKGGEMIGTGASTDAGAGASADAGAEASADAGAGAGAGASADAGAGAGEETRVATHPGTDASSVASHGGENAGGEESNGLEPLAGSGTAADPMFVDSDFDDADAHSLVELGRDDAKSSNSQQEGSSHSESGSDHGGVSGGDGSDSVDDGSDSTDHGSDSMDDGSDSMDHGSGSMDFGSDSSGNDTDVSNRGSASLGDGSYISDQGSVSIDEGSGSVNRGGDSADHSAESGGDEGISDGTDGDGNTTDGSDNGNLMGMLDEDEPEAANDAEAGESTGSGTDNATGIDIQNGRGNQGDPIGEPEAVSVSCSGRKRVPAKWLVDYSDPNAIDRFAATSSSVREPTLKKTSVRGGGSGAPRGSGSATTAGGSNASARIPNGSSSVSSMSSVAGQIQRPKAGTSFAKDTAGGEAGSKKASGIFLSIGGTAGAVTGNNSYAQRACSPSQLMPPPPAPGASAANRSDGAANPQVAVASSSRPANPPASVIADARKISPWGTKDWSGRARSKEMEAEVKENERCYPHKGILMGEDGNHFFCSVCGAHGDVICCDKCPRVFHEECLVNCIISRLAAKFQTDEDPWFCPSCVQNGGQNTIGKKIPDWAKLRREMEAELKHGAGAEEKHGAGAEEKLKDNAPAGPVAPTPTLSNIPSRVPAREPIPFTSAPSTAVPSVERSCAAPSSPRPGSVWFPSHVTASGSNGGDGGSSNARASAASRTPRDASRAVPIDASRTDPVNVPLNSNVAPAAPPRPRRRAARAFTPELDNLLLRSLLYEEAYVAPNFRRARAEQANEMGGNGPGAGGGQDAENGKKKGGGNGDGGAPPASSPEKNAPGKGDKPDPEGFRAISPRAGARPPWFDQHDGPRLGPGFGGPRTPYRLLDGTAATFGPRARGSFRAGLAASLILVGLVPTEAVASAVRPAGWGMEEHEAMRGRNARSPEDAVVDGGNPRNPPAARDCSSVPRQCEGSTTGDDDDDGVIARRRSGHVREDNDTASDQPRSPTGVSLRGESPVSMRVSTPVDSYAASNSPVSGGMGTSGDGDNGMEETGMRLEGDPANVRRVASWKSRSRNRNRNRNRNRISEQEAESVDGRGSEAGRERSCDHSRALVGRDDKMDADGYKDGSATTDGRDDREGPRLPCNRRRSSPVEREAKAAKKASAPVPSDASHIHRRWNLKHMKAITSMGSRWAKHDVCITCRSHPDGAAMVCTRPDIGKTHMFCFSCVAKKEGITKSDLISGKVKLLGCDGCYVCKGNAVWLDRSPVPLQQWECPACRQRSQRPTRRAVQAPAAIRGADWERDSPTPSSPGGAKVTAGRGGGIEASTTARAAGAKRSFSEIEAERGDDRGLVPGLQSPGARSSFNIDGTKAFEASGSPHANINNAVLSRTRSGVAQDGAPPANCGVARHPGFEQYTVLQERLQSKGPLLVGGRRLLRFVSELALDRLQELDPFQLFAEPVSKDVKDYYTVIRYPIDFSTIRRRAQWGLYGSLVCVALEVKLMCANARAFNGEGSFYAMAARVVLDGAERIWPQAEKLLERLNAAEIIAERYRIRGPAHSSEAWPLDGPVTAFELNPANEDAYYMHVAIRRIAAATRAAAAVSADASLISNIPQGEDEAGPNSAAGEWIKNKKGPGTMAAAVGAIVASSATLLYTRGEMHEEEVLLRDVLSAYKGQLKENALGPAIRENPCARCNPIDRKSIHSMRNLMRPAPRPVTRREEAPDRELLHLPTNTDQPGPFSPIPHLKGSPKSNIPPVAPSWKILHNADLATRRRGEERINALRTFKMYLERVAQCAGGRLMVAASSVQGLGLHAIRSIRAHELVIEYVGECVGFAVAERRAALYKRESRPDYIVRLDEKTYIDATHKGNVARFINHSCAPNCYVKSVTAGENKRVCIFSLKDISEHEEITYGYSPPHTVGLGVVVAGECFCKAPGCRGRMSVKEQR